MRSRLRGYVQEQQQTILKQFPSSVNLSLALDCWNPPFGRAFMAGKFLACRRPEERRSIVCNVHILCILPSSSHDDQPKKGLGACNLNQTLDHILTDPRIRRDRSEGTAFDISPPRHRKLMKPLVKTLFLFRFTKLHHMRLHAKHSFSTALKIPPKLANCIFRPK